MITGYEVVVYADYNFTGTSYTLNADDACLVDNGINDWISSVRVRARSFSTTIQAESYSNMAGVQTETTTDAGGGLNVGWIDTNDWMAYNSINIPTTGSYLIEYRVASPNTAGQLSLDLNAGSVQLGALNIPSTGGWQNWTTVSHTVNIDAGTYNFGIFASAGGWNINWWRIARASAARELTLPGESPDEETSLALWPNPANDVLNIKVDPSFIGGRLTVIDNIGSEAILTTYTGGILDISHLKKGLYIFIINKKGRRVVKKFLKN